MKHRTAIIIIAIFTLVANQRISFAQVDRTPVYVHGLGDNSTQWQHWQSLFNTERRMVQGTNNSYNSRDGVANFASQVTLPSASDRANAIIFGHSTGGVVARHLERTASTPFGGIITAGAPLDGARISNSLNTGAAASFITNGVDNVLKGPIREFGNTLGILYEVASHKFKDMAEREVNGVLNTLLSGTTANDLAEGSAYLKNGHRDAYSSMPKIHIYGNENSPVLWRIASIAAGWQDGELPSATQQAYEVCKTMKNGNIAKTFLNPFGAGLYHWRAQGWDISGNWINDGSERGWNDLIGASIPATITTSSQVLNSAGFGQCMTAAAASSGGQPTYAQYLQCQQQNTTTVWTTTYSPVNSLSDGFIKAPSQSGYNSPWSNNATKIEALGVNHLEMKEHTEMTRIYNGIFDRTISTVDPFFRTTRR